jgi:growth factor-regulated tyrosine kinase substrate
MTDIFPFQVMESIVKNCGAPVHQEIATAHFMEEMRELVKQSQDDNVKSKVLELIQTWGMAFKNSQKYRIVAVRKVMKSKKAKVSLTLAQYVLLCRV